MGLENKIIISTRPLSKDDELKKYLTENGAILIDFPLIEIIGIPIDDDSKKIIENLYSFNWLVFTSRNGVDHFFGMLNKLRFDYQNLKESKVATIGTKTTNELRKRGIEPSFESNGNTSKELSKELVNNVITKGDKVLLVLGELAGNRLEDEISGIAEVERINVYKTIEKKSYANVVVDRIKADNYDLLVFTSPSGFRNFIRIMKINNIRSDFRIGCIGKTTADEVIKLGYKPALISTTPESLNFAKEIEEYFN